MYNEGLRAIAGIHLPVPDLEPAAHHVYHQYTISVPADKRDDLQNHLAEKEINTMVYYPFPLHNMKVFQNGRSVAAGRLDVAELSTRSVLSLPIEPLQGREETFFIAESLREFYHEK